MPTQKKSGSKKAAPEGQESGSITFSTRFTEEQRDRIVAAAEVRGWTPSNLMRVATLEKAAHILNTSRPTKFDFKSLAQRVAQQLVAPGAEAMTYEKEIPGGLTPLTTGDVESTLHKGLEGEFGNLPYTVSLDRLSGSDLAQLKQGARLGGVELLHMIIQACESLVAPHSDDLPEPIEPV